MTAYSIENTTNTDMNFIYYLFESAIAYQQRKKTPVWKSYDKQVIQQDIDLKKQYKIVIDQQIACIFSICQDDLLDRLIWREKDKRDAVYLHRIVVNPNFKGQKHFQKIFNWAIAYAQSKGLSHIRMDTWANNPEIIAYYQSFGFIFLENFKLSDSPDIPIQNRNLDLALLEFKL
ncbi:MAG: hypothetical protein RL329_973 [Bacteroidota bacterium]|jgi:ribosomal protein S18 acetylase RimI-like enzyme